MIEKTGYVSKDRPYNQYYRERPVRELDPNLNLYEQIFSANQGNMDYTAINYIGETWSFEDLQKEIDRLASAYKAAGVKEGDVVALSLINVPEAAFNLIALNKIGAVSKWLDVRASGNHLAHYINEHDCEFVVSIDLIADKVEEIINKTNIKQVLTISPADSLNALKRVAFKIKSRLDKKLPKEFTDPRFIKMKDFIKHYGNNEIIKPVPFDIERPAAIIQSSGTTGMAKSIVHNNYLFTKLVDTMAYTDLPLYPGKKILVLIPPFVAYGLSDSLYSSMAYGMEAVLSPTFDENILHKYAGKYTITFAAPFHIKYLAEHAKTLNSNKLSRIEYIASGGDKITPEELNFIKEQTGVRVINGWGNNEGGGMLTYNPLLNVKEGTIGIPRPFDEVMICDPETGEELPYNNEGEICFSSKTMFSEYSNNPDETKRVKRLHDDGKYWVHTGDLGIMDEDGYITLSGRIARVIIRQAFKISPLNIEAVITAHPAVKECIAVGVSDKEESFVPMSFYTLKDDIIYNEDQVHKEILSLCISELKSYQVPKYFRQVEELPLTDNNKYDFKRLEAIAEQYVLDNAPKIRTKK